VSGRGRTLADPRTVEAYIRAGVIPRFMTRLREIDDELADHRRRLERTYRELQHSCGSEARVFEARWLAVARTWRFDHVNELITQHNEYYPIERNLAVDPRTGDYVTVGGRPYRRELVGESWILGRFPALLGGRSEL